MLVIDRMTDLAKAIGWAAVQKDPTIHIDGLTLKYPDLTIRPDLDLRAAAEKFVQVCTYQT